MAKSGTKAAVGQAASAGSEETRHALVRGAVEALRDVGYAGASAREIARRAGCNQGLVFYHFGSVPNLLLAALDEVSETRRLRYQEAVDRASGLEGLVDTAQAVFEEDLDAGHIAVLAEMIAGASSTPGLAPEVAARIAPWRTFAADAVGGVLDGTPLSALVEPDLLGARGRGPLSRARDAGAPRRGSGAGARAVRPGPTAGGSVADVRGRWSPGGDDMTQAHTLSEAATLRSSEGFDVVTGAFSYSGGAIARRLLDTGRSVRTLTGHPDRAGAGQPIDVRSLDFDDVLGLTRSLEGATTLYNTYWVRFAHGGDDHDRAVANSRTLFHAARQAGVERIVHVSITHPSISSPYAYFRGKAEVERALAEVDVPYAVLRPAILFGGDGVLINNIAWLLRHLPVFGVGGRGDYRIRAVHVDDLASLAVAAGARAGHYRDRRRGSGATDVLRAGRPRFGTRSGAGAWWCGSPARWSRRWRLSWGSPCATSC